MRDVVVLKGNRGVTEDLWKRGRGTPCHASSPCTSTSAEASGKKAFQVLQYPGPYQEYSIGEKRGSCADLT